jgi:hypothetical protein
MRAEEEYVPWDVLEPLLDDLWKACQRLDCVAGRNLLLKAVAGYAPGDAVSDLVWQERNRGADGGSSTAPRPAVAGRESNVTPLNPSRAAAARRELN